MVTDEKKKEQEEQAKLNADKANAQHTHMIADQTTKTKLVKIRAITPIAPDGVNTVAPGGVVEVSEAAAKEFCDRVFKGNYSFGGERSNQTAERHMVRRAERVA